MTSMPNDLQAELITCEAEDRYPLMVAALRGSLEQRHAASTPEGLAADLAACEAWEKDKLSAPVVMNYAACSMGRFPQVVRELIEARAEIERLRDENAKLRLERMAPVVKLELD